jgi:hypothetical protein
VPTVESVRIVMSELAADADLLRGATPKTRATDAALAHKRRYVKPLSAPKRLASTAPLLRCVLTVFTLGRETR